MNSSNDVNPPAGDFKLDNRESEMPLKTTPDSDRYCLLTGATGLVGQYLVRDLGLAGVRLVVVARGKRKWSAKQRIDEICEFWEAETGQTIPRPVVLAGDVAEPSFGLSEDALDWVEEHCDTIIHNAAILQFHGSSRDAEPWRTNFGGTRNALAVSERCNISKMHYVSTAYVCGEVTELVSEEHFSDASGFRNEYEKAKFEAEKLVRESDQFTSTTIYRPVVISGDSVTGYTSNYHGLYVYLRLFSMFVPQQERGPDGKILTPVKIPLEGNEPRNVVPVDWVSKVFCELFFNPAAHGKTFHLAPDHFLTPVEVIEACYEYFDSHGVEFTGEPLPEDHEHPDYASTIFDNVAIYQQYESSDPRFDTSNLKQFAGHIECPRIDMKMLHRYMDFGIADNWGKRKKLKVVKDADAQTATA